MINYSSFYTQNYLILNHQQPHENILSDTVYQYLPTKADWFLQLLPPLKMFLFPTLIKQWAFYTWKIKIQVKTVNSCFFTCMQLQNAVKHFKFKSQYSGFSKVGGGGASPSSPPSYIFFWPPLPHQNWCSSWGAPSPLKNEAWTSENTPPPLKHEAPFHEMIPRKSTINNNFKI